MSVSYYIFALNIFAAKCIEIKECDYKKVVKYSSSRGHRDDKAKEKWV